MEEQTYKNFIKNWQLSPMTMEDVSDEAYRSICPQHRNQIEAENILRKHLFTPFLTKYSRIEDYREEWLDSFGQKDSYCGNPYINVSCVGKALSTLQFWAEAKVAVKTRGLYSFRLWTYMAGSLFVDGQRVQTFSEASYQPILKHEFTLELDAGIHELTFLWMNMAVRDTRNIFALEVLEGKEHVSQDLVQDLLYQVMTHEELKADLIQKIAEKESAPRGAGVKFGIYHVLARKHLGFETQKDWDLILDDLDLVDQRIDCADFLLIGLFRYYYVYGFPETIEKRFKEVLLNFRFWMDQEGSDSMCYWSENHSLMFFGLALSAGELFPDEDFVRSHLKGKALAELSLERCRNWLSVIESFGMEEYQSTTYFPVTMAALLHLIDFGPEDLTQRSEKLLDELLRQIMLHFFKGAVFSPQGRVYGDVVRPYLSSLQNVLAYLLPGVLPGKGEPMWLSNFLTSRYEAPEGLLGLASKSQNIHYNSGHSQINLYKSETGILTSVTSPYNPTTELPANEIGDLVKLNTQYHGTTHFLPDIPGYQQHLFYAALSREALLFVNYPGVFDLNEAMRPGYWYGNLRIPELTQDGSKLTCTYKLTPDYPINFTHVYCPIDKFDEVNYQDRKILVGLGKAKIRLESNQDLVPYWRDGQLTEWRCYADEVTYTIELLEEG